MYGTVMKVRNWCFDHGWLEQREASLPVISVGNLAVGGTGKTPMVELLTAALRTAGHRPTIISRGYGRTTSGVRVAHPRSTAAEIGDEPLQIYKRYEGEVPVIVSEDRRKALPHVDASATLLILDDAYQHRYVQRQCNILLTDYHRLYTRDRILPFGRLRESATGAQRADIIVVTKCPAHLSREEAESLRKELTPLPSQSLFFATIAYAPLAEEIRQAESVTLLTGIANPAPLLEHLEAEGIKVTKHLCYKDHHRFSNSELADLRRLAAAGPLLTTEKDAARLPGIAATPLPIHTEILFNQQELFINTILNHVNRN